MTFIVADRVQETGTVSTGTGSVSLAGAVNGYQSFVSGIGNGNTCYYTIYDPTAFTWEVGIGTVTSGPNTLARTTVLSNSAGTQPSKISFSTSDTLSVWCDYPAETAIYTGANASLNTVTATSTAFPLATASSGVYSYGNINYSDTGIWASYAANVNSYAQVIYQNTNNGTSASTDIIVSSNGGTATTNYGDFGINSSTFSASGSVLNSPGVVYLYSQSTDLAIGTNTSNAIHFVINNLATDAMTINAASSVAFNGQYGSPGQVLTSQGSSSAPTWSAVSVSPAGSNTQVQYNNSGSFGASSSFTFDGTTQAAPVQSASNGIFVNNQTVGTSYSIPSGYSAMSSGPISVAAGQSVTVPAGSRWVVL